MSNELLLGVDGWSSGHQRSTDISAPDAQRSVQLLPVCDVSVVECNRIVTQSHSHTVKTSGFTLSFLGKLKSCHRCRQ